jgi:hypothetical protein
MGTADRAIDILGGRRSHLGDALAAAGGRDRIPCLRLDALTTDDEQVALATHLMRGAFTLTSRRRSAARTFGPDRRYADDFPNSPRWVVAVDCLSIMLRLAPRGVCVGGPKLELVYVAADEAVVACLPNGKDDPVVMGAWGIRSKRPKHSERPAVGAV